MLEINDFNLEETTIWSFKNRGNWATHKGDYPGNWSPYVPRNLILRYSKENDWILDQFVGSGTTLIEAKLLNRNAIGTDINSIAIEKTKKNIDFNCINDCKLIVEKCNAIKLNFIKDGTIDFICTHPPYSNIINYSLDIEGDLSLYEDEKYFVEMKKVAKEALRVLKKGKYCAIMIGDRRVKGDVVPLGFNLMQIFLHTGFKLKEIIIKQQHNCKSTTKWAKIKKNFLMLAHEYIFVFYK